MTVNCLIKDLSKSYATGFKLGPVGLSIGKGEIIGLLGVNGAGKTTLIRLLLGALRADTGSVRLLGFEVGKQPFVKRWIGYLDEEPIHYEWMRIQWLARFYASYYPDWNNDRFLGYLSTFKLDQKMRISRLSKGNKVRLGVATSLAHTPRLLLLDEPTSGLDPLIRVEILDSIAQYVQETPTASVLFSSHITSDLERVCNRAVVLESGRVISDTRIQPANQLERLKHSSSTRDLSLEERFLSSLTTYSIQ